MRIFFPALIAFTILAFTVTFDSWADTHASLASIIENRSEQDKARDSARNPQQTLEFFGLKPGTVVAEALPGGGWYTKIIAPYLGGQGTLYGVNYKDEMWPMFGFFDKAGIERAIAATPGFPATVAGLTDNGVSAQGFTFTTVPGAARGSVDTFLLIRALHNLARFEKDADTLSEALTAIHALVKPGGIVGVVQHRAPESASDSWADGSRGYLKQSFVISAFEDAGFKLLQTSEINANSRDKPGEEDIVWRLPPSLVTSGDNPELRAEMQAIGESDRMTLKFAKTTD